MTRVVEVRTGARLHFGLLGTKADAGRLGGIGMMIDRPGCVVRGRIAERDQVAGDDPAAVERVRKLLWELDPLRRRQTDRRDVAAAAVSIEIAASIPSHRGFGSGTQLAFALGDLLTALDVVMIDDRPGTFQRGRRSVVGSLGYSVGGFVVDFGAHPPDHIERRVELRPVPADWRFVVVDPATGDTWSGECEAGAFRAAAPMPAATRDALIQQTVASVLPGLDRSDFPTFAAGIAEFNRLVGEHFAPVQGGVYAHPLIRELSRTLAGTAWPHLAQSSWGPSVVVFCENQASAAALDQFLKGAVPPAEANVFIASPRNVGASVETIDA